MGNINTDDPNDEPTQAEVDAYELSQAINEFSERFDILCKERHEAGKAEYGAITFLGNDVVRMMMEELADTANYCRMQFIKLMMLQNMLEQDESVQKLAGGDGELEIGIGKDSFKGVGETGWNRG